MQTKRQSAAEAVVNVAIGYVIAIASQIIIFPAVGVTATFGQNLAIGIGFTIVSLVRQYAVRRWFNRRHHFVGATEKV